MSILCTCCSHFSWYCFTSFTIFSAPVFSLIHWFFSLSSFVIPRRCLKNFICAKIKRHNYCYRTHQSGCHEDAWERGYLVQIFLTPAPYICSFTPRPIYSWGKNSLFTFHRRLEGLQRQPECCAEQSSVCICRELNYDSPITRLVYIHYTH